VAVELEPSAEPEPVAEEPQARLPGDRDRRNRRGGGRSRDRAPAQDHGTDLEAEIDRALLEQKGIPPRDPRTLRQGRQEPETDAYAEQPQREYIQRDYYASRNRDVRRDGGARDRDSWRVTRSPLPQQQSRTDSTQPRSAEALIARQNVLFEEFTQQQTQTLREIQRMVTNIGRAAGAGGGGTSLLALPKVGIFLDVPNLIYAAEQIGARIDFGKLLDFLTEGRQLVRATAYAPITDDPSTRFESQRFVQPVINNGYKIVTKPWKRFADGGMKANFDIELAVDILTMSDRLDVVVLLSGDGDFRRVVELVESKGVRVEVVSFAASTAMELRSVADAYIDLGSILHIVGP
jgi:uncharacterized LabA/DUF88 family protein